MYLSSELSPLKLRNTFHSTKHLKYVKIGRTNFTPNIIGVLGTEKTICVAHLETDARTNFNSSSGRKSC